MRDYLIFIGLVMLAACAVAAYYETFVVFLTSLLALACVGTCAGIRHAFRALTRTHG